MGQRPAGYKPAVADDRTPYNGPLPASSPVPAGYKPPPYNGPLPVASPVPAGYKPPPYNGSLPVSEAVPAGREPAVAGRRVTHDDLPHPFTTAKGRRRATFRDRPA
jgi:hypothetical protein